MYVCNYVQFIILGWLSHFIKIESIVIIIKKLTLTCDWLKSADVFNKSKTRENSVTSKLIDQCVIIIYILQFAT